MAMKNTLTDLNNYLFEQLERLQDDDLNPEELEKEINRSKAVTSVAETIIQNGELAIKSVKIMYDCGVDVSNAKLPLMLESEK